MKGYTKISKQDKLDILGLIEASPIKKSQALGYLGLCENRYYRWQLKYYLDNCLDDRRGRFKKRYPRLEDHYRQQIVTIRQEGVYGKYVIGPETIMARLEDEGIFLSHETIRQILHREGLIEPRPKIVRHEYRRFQADHANAMWQMDILHAFVWGYGYLYLFNILDDFSRRIMHWDLLPLATGKEAIEVLKEAMACNQVKPESILTDRGTQFYSGEGKGYGRFEKYLEAEEIKHILARVRHPQTLGKVERYHRTLRQMCLNLKDFSDPLELRRAIRVFVDEYNYRRKHKAIGRVTPHQRYTGEDQQIIRKREELRKMFLAQRNSQRLSDDQLQKEFVCLEVVTSIKKAYAKEVVLV